MADSVSSRRTLGIEWRVKNIFQVNSLDTQTFGFGGSRWQFQLRKQSEYISIYLSRTSSKNAPLNEFTVEVFIEDRNRNSHFPNKSILTRELSEIWLQYAPTLRTQEEIISTDGVVTFFCLFLDQTTSEDKIETGVSTQTAENMDLLASFERLSLDFHHLLDDTLLSDVRLKCGDHTIPAHRNVLSARSEVFLAMFRSDMAESRTGIIEMSDMEPSTLDQLVQYIYSGRVSELSADSAQQLYAAADKYAIDSLKTSCWNYMKENLTEENACHFLAFADAHGDKDVKNYVLSFMMKTELLQVKDRWIKFLKDHPELAAEALHHVYTAKCSPK